MQKNNEICISETQKMSVWTPPSTAVTLLLYIIIIHVYLYSCSIHVSLCSNNILYCIFVWYIFCWCKLLCYCSSGKCASFKNIGCYFIHYNITFYCSDIKPINQIYKNSVHNFVTIVRILKTHPFTSWSLIHTFIRSTIPVHSGCVYP